MEAGISDGSRSKGMAKITFGETIEQPFLYASARVNLKQWSPTRDGLVFKDGMWQKRGVVSGKHLAAGIAAGAAVGGTIRGIRYLRNRKKAKEA